MQLELSLEQEPGPERQRRKRIPASQAGAQKRQGQRDPDDRRGDCHANDPESRRGPPDQPGRAPQRVHADSHGWLPPRSATTPEKVPEPKQHGKHCRDRHGRFRGDRRGHTFGNHATPLHCLQKGEGTKRQNDHLDVSVRADEE